MKKALLILMSIIVFGCSKDDNSPTEPIEQNLTVESNNVKTFEVVSVTVNNLELTDNTYQATFGNSEITLVKFDDNSLIFSIPEIEEGTYSLSLSLGTVELNVTETQVLNTDEIIQDVFDDFSADIGNLDNSDPFIASEITEAESYNTEVLALYNSLNDEQKRQTAMFYEANKEVFKNEIASNLNGLTALSRTSQSDCPTVGFKSIYSCRAANLGSSAIALKNSSKEFLQILALAGASAYLAPASFGLSAVGTFLGLGTAAYIYMTEVRPSFIMFKSSLRSFIGANWILTQATFSVITDEFTSESQSSLNVMPDFRSISSNDNGISEETGFFITSLNTLNGFWNQLTALFGSPINFQETSENIDFDDNTDQITITNISNSNVELESLNGQNVKFKSLSGNDESFSFDVEFSKEGFIENRTISASVSIEEFNYQGDWLMHWYNISDGALVQSDRITFNALGNSTSAEFYQYPNQNGWMSYPDDNYTIFYNGILTVTDIYFGLALPFDVITVDDTIFYGTAGTYNLELIRQ
ncbi:hypothetical protein [Croceibacter atlanticus]|jgi:hypothetical protein|uniref:Lipoprotein n=1 Tax=Croceibacter atlanticus (strain ATCC BAA-628 / JCM 21780 / CIP 108009 / IAM 15332 / KCTC 12090 / HTCC2559) TaxID=216432 RepID=A3U7A4_CROAH|nr:hypothetical protein [Croceibacter atlanticus]EAP88121.1 hypothetical protein CA2559_05160 [Croceibacter atlanticus HTCC2559]